MTIKRDTLQLFLSFNKRFTDTNIFPTRFDRASGEDVTTADKSSAIKSKITLK